MKQKTDSKRDRKTMKCVAFWVPPKEFQTFRLRIIGDNMTMQEWGENIFRRYLSAK